MEKEEKDFKSDFKNMVKIVDSKYSDEEERYLFIITLAMILPTFLCFMVCLYKWS